MNPTTESTGALRGPTAECEAGAPADLVAAVREFTTATAAVQVETLSRLAEVDPVAAVVIAVSQAHRMDERAREWLRFSGRIAGDRALRVLLEGETVEAAATTLRSALHRAREAHERGALP